MARAIITKMPSPQLLPVVNDNSHGHPIAQNMHNREVGKLAFTLATAAAVSMLSSQKFPASDLGYVAVAGLMCGCAAVWNGVLFGSTSVEMAGIGLIFVCFYGLVASFLPLRFAWACWLAAALSLVPFLCIVINPHPQQQQQPQTFSALINAFIRCREEILSKIHGFNIRIDHVAAQVHEVPDLENGIGSHLANSQEQYIES